MKYEQKYEYLKVFFIFLSMVYFIPRENILDIHVFKRFCNLEKLKEFLRINNEIYKVTFPHTEHQQKTSNFKTLFFKKK